MSAMLRVLLGLVPAWGWVLMAAAAVATAAGWHLHQLHQARAEGRGEIQALWDAAELQRERQANADAARRAESAMAASAAHETARASIARNLIEARHALQYALRTPISCPVGQPAVAVGDVVLPAAALDSVRRAAGGGGGEHADRAAPAQPVRPVP